MDKEYVWAIGGIVAIMIAIGVLIAMVPPNTDSSSSHGCIYVKSGKVLVPICH